MWRRLPEPEDHELTWVRRSKNMRLYADEDVEEEAVEYLRERGVNIASARERGHRGKPDSFQAALAKRERRFLLTKNARHFLSDSLLPPSQTHGVIVIDDDMSDPKRYVETLDHLVNFIPLGELLEGDKMRIGPVRVSIRGRHEDGRMVTTNYRNDREGAFIWIEDEEGS